VLRRVRAMTLDAYSHRELPFDRLVEELRPDRQASHTPLFQVLFVMQNAIAAGRSQDAVRFSTVGGGVRSSKYDIGLFLTEGRSALGASWVYRSDLFDASTIRTMAGDFEAVLRAAAAAPEITVAELRTLLLTRAGEHAESEVEKRRSANRARLRAGLAGTGRRSS
jgi:non-ribosomal peptide synthetase component F